MGQSNAYKQQQAQLEQLARLRFHPPSVWVVNRFEEADGLYVFEDEHRARTFHERYPSTSTLSEEIVMNDSAAGQFLIDEGDDEESAVGTRVHLPDGMAGTVTDVGYSPTHGEDQWTVDRDDTGRPECVLASHARVIEEADDAQA